jgi:hypothetical protein
MNIHKLARARLERGHLQAPDSGMGCGVYGSNRDCSRQFHCLDRCHSGNGLWKQNVESSSCCVNFGCEHVLVIVIISKIETRAACRIEQKSDLAETVRGYESVCRMTQLTPLFSCPLN